MYFIPTYNEAKLIVDSNPDMVFFCTEHMVSEYRIVIFSYKLAWYNEFINPVPNTNITAHEMRGLTFVFNEDGSLFNRYILLKKFWNINQNEETTLNVLKDKKIKSISDKLDGSIASFIKLPNGEVVGKSKASFISEQALEINKIYKTNADIKRFVDYTLDNNLIAIFEYVSPMNKVVLDYSEPKLILLKLRNNISGEYIDIDSFDKSILANIDIANYEEIRTLEDILEEYKTVENKEGCVIQFDDDYFIKIKTDWYFKKHRLFTESLTREDDIIRIILDEKLDDVLSQLGDSEVDKFKREFILSIYDKINIFIHKKIKSIDTKCKNNNHIDRKEFYNKFKNDKDIHLLMRVISGFDSFDIVKDHILKQTNALEKAKKFINEIS